MSLKVDTTALEIEVTKVSDDEIEGNKRLLLLTDVPESLANSDNPPPTTRFSIPWSSANLSQTINLSKENFYDEDMDRLIPVTVPDCEAEVLKMIAMYLEYYSERPEAVGVTAVSSSSTTTTEAAAAKDDDDNNNSNNGGGLPSAAAAKTGTGADDIDEDINNDDAGDALARQRRQTARAKQAIVNKQQQAVCKTGAHLLERPYKPNQMEVALDTVVDGEACLAGYEAYLAKRINKMSLKDAVRTCRQLLCAGFFLQMNQSFMDLAGWLLTLRMRGNNVHQIKEMMKEENIEVRPDKI